MADALVSVASAGKDVGVKVPPRAPESNAALEVQTAAQSPLLIS